VTGQMIGQVTTKGGRALQESAPTMLIVNREASREVRRLKKIMSESGFPYLERDSLAGMVTLRAWLRKL